jgi:hypothetical protein
MFGEPHVVHRFSQGSSNHFGQATISVSEIGYKRRDGRAAMDTCILGSSIFLERIINLVHQRIRITQRSFSVADRLEESEHVA